MGSSEGPGVLVSGVSSTDCKIFLVSYHWTNKYIGLKKEIGDCFFAWSWEDNCTLWCLLALITVFRVMNRL